MNRERESISHPDCACREVGRDVAGWRGASKQAQAPIDT